MYKMLALLVFSIPATAGDCPPAGDANTRPVFDASLLREGRFVYRTTHEGKLLGDMTLEIRRIGANTRITMSAPGIAQAWQAVVTSTFAPLSAELAMGKPDARYTMRLLYDGATVSGEENKGGVITSVRDTLNGVVLDQRVDWAAIMALREPRRGAVAMSVFDPATKLSPMHGRIRGSQVMRGAWGRASTVRLDYAICKRDRVENYTVYASKEYPRYMLREDMPNGLVTELVRMEP
jgi:hypothetical protein